MSQFYCRFLFGIRGWCSTIEEAIDTTSKIRKIRCQIDEREGKNCCLVLNVQSQRLRISVLHNCFCRRFHCFIEPGNSGMIKALLEVNSGLEKIRLQNVHQKKITNFLWHDNICWIVNVGLLKKFRKWNLHLQCLLHLLELIRRFWF